MSSTLRMWGTNSGARVRPNAIIRIAAVAILITSATAPAAHAQTLTIIHSFRGPEGEFPNAGLIRDSAGNFYGASTYGGVAPCAPAMGGGTVFEMDYTGKTTGLHAFSGGSDGCFPSATVIRDENGNLYGATMINDVYELDASGKFTVLHTFTGAPDGDSPIGNLVRDAEGNLYGVTTLGGSSNLGTIYKITPSGEEAILYSFLGGTDGAFPSGLMRDDAGNFYGTTTYGGHSICDAGFGCGTIFKLDSTGKETVLHTFTGGADGGNPFEGVIRDQAGNLYGTTSMGGDHHCRPAQFGCGTVYKLSATGALAVLHTFTGGSDGAYTESGVIQDAAGNLYGTTVYGGDLTCNCGTVFKVDAKGKETVLHRFVGPEDGEFPSGVIRDEAGNLYGMTDLGGSSNLGAIYKLAP